MISGFEDWLPPVTKRVEDDQKHIELLRLKFRGAVKVTLASPVLLAAGVLGIGMGYDETGPAAFWLIPAILAALGGLAGSIGGLIDAVSWHRDHRSVQATGWRRGRVRSASVASGPKRTLLSMLVEYDDGSCIRLWSGNSGPDRAVFHDRHRQVLVGGTDRRMVVLFGVRDSKPVLVKAIAETYRWTPE